MSRESVDVVIEIPKGSRNKYEMDRESGRMRLDRRLFASVAYPTEYGFVPETQAGDGDELDALVCTTEPTVPGCLVATTPVALLRLRTGGGDGGSEPNPKLVCVPVGDPAWDHVAGLDDLPEELRHEIAHFFSVYNELGGGETEIEGWAGRDEALEHLELCRERFHAAA